MKKKGFKRVVFIVCIVFAVVLAVVGVICVNSINHTGIEKQQAEESAVLSNVRNTSKTDPLTDDQFEKGWDKIMPADITTDEVYSQRIGVISRRLEELGESATFERVNYFGQCACIMHVEESLVVEDIVDALKESALNRAYIEVQRNGLTLTAEYLYSNNKLQKLYDSSENIGELQQSAELIEMFEAVCNEYSIQDSGMQFTQSILRLNLNNVQYSDELNIFDYVYQWCRVNNLSTVIQIFSNGSIHAIAYVDLEDDTYEKYETAQDMIGTYRIKYYIASNFFVGGLKDVAQSYLT